jgi:hypothetical protein
MSSDSPRADRPLQVRGASWLLGTSLVLGMVCFVLEWQATPSALQPISTMLALSITATLIALLVFVIYKVWAGRNWARFVYVLIFVVGVYDAVEVFQMFSVVAVLTLTELLAQLVALYLVFSAPGKMWFPARKIDT